MEDFFIWVSIWAVLILAIWVIIGMLWRFIRNFFHNNYSFFDISFILSYFIQQFILILLLQYNPQRIVLWVGLFALIVVTTAALQKLTMDSRDRELRDLYTIERHIKEETEGFNYSLLEENEGLKKQIKKLSDYIIKNNIKLKK